MKKRSDIKFVKLLIYDRDWDMAYVVYDMIIGEYKGRIGEGDFREITKTFRKNGIVFDVEDCGYDKRSD